jgi:hypothetical protein
VTFDRIHNGLLDLAVTQGLLGVVALGAVVGVVAYGAWKHRFSGSVGPLAAACVGYTVWVLFNFDWAPATGAFWLLLGTCWSGARADEPGEVPDRTAAPAWRALGAAGLAVVAGVLAAAPILAETWYAQGRAELAVRADPFQSQYHRAYGESLIGQGYRGDGLQELRLAASLGNSDPGLWVELGDEELALGDADAARADYRMALVIDPFWDPAKQRLATTGGANSATPPNLPALRGETFAT